MAERDYFVGGADDQQAPTPDFQGLIEPYRHEILVHCYRFLGSLEDAEDALQETSLRAWRRLDTLKEPGALRAWLYKIATRVSLDAIERQKARTLPSSLYPPADPKDRLPAPIDDPIWLDPLPEEYLDGNSADPAARNELRESVSLAFLVLLQQLPGRQRAVLILRDVLGWTAKETAETLDFSSAAANSALQRARATMEKYRREYPSMADKKMAGMPYAALINKYQQAWETADLDSLLELLHEDVIYSMPPLPVWYQGRDAMRAFLQSYLFSGQAGGRFKLLAFQANGSPAFAIYQSAAGNAFNLASLQILSLRNNQIARVDVFLNPGRPIIEKLKLPASL